MSVDKFKYLVNVILMYVCVCVCLYLCKSI